MIDNEFHFTTTQTDSLSALGTLPNMGLWNFMGRISPLDCVKDESLCNIIKTKTLLNGKQLVQQSSSGITR